MGKSAKTKEQLQAAYMERMASHLRRATDWIGKVQKSRVKLATPEATEQLRLQLNTLNANLNQWADIMSPRPQTTVSPVAPQPPNG